MEITIKTADASSMQDLMQWREIVLREVFSVPAEENMEALLASNREYYSAALENESHIACFAYAGEQIVGCGGVCFYQEMPSPDNPNGKCAYLMNIYTVPNMRKQGIGKAIVEYLIQEALHHDAGKIYLEASENAGSFYKELGFCEMDGYLKYNK